MELIGYDSDFCSPFLYQSSSTCRRGEKKADLTLQPSDLPGMYLVPSLPDQSRGKPDLLLSEDAPDSIGSHGALCQVMRTHSLAWRPLCESEQAVET
jgi:hypothetical protein